MKNILLIDGDGESLRSNGDILTGLGYRVVSEQDGFAALSRLNSGLSVDLIITDCKIPGMSGLEIFFCLKRSIPSVPVIMMASRGSVEAYLQALNAGAFEYVHKPVRAKDLERVVASAFKRSSAA